MPIDSSKENPPSNSTVEPKQDEVEQTKSDANLVRQSSIYDVLLSKYIAVWLWSIIFGAVSGVFYSFISYRGYGENFRLLYLFSSVTTTIGIAAAVVSFFSLYKALVNYLIPKFFLDKEPRAEILAGSLKNAFLMLIISLVVRLTLSLFEVYLTSLML